MPGMPATVRKVSDIGRHSVVEAMAGDISVKAVIEGPAPEQGAARYIWHSASSDQTRLYRRRLDRATER